MEISPAQYDQIKSCLPRQRGNVSLSNLQVLNAILYMAEHGCGWRSLPKRFGNWHTIYTRMNRWSKLGVLGRVFVRLQQLRLVRIRLEVVSLDSIAVDGQSDGAAVAGNRSRNRSGRPAAVGPAKFIWMPQILERS